MADRRRGISMLGVVIVIALVAAALPGCGSDNASDQLAEQEKQIEELERRLGEGERSGSSTAPGSSTSDSPGSFAPAAPASPTPPITGTQSSPATPPGYWKRCGDVPNANATRVEHHNEDCSTAERIAGKYSRDDPDPEDWSCMSRRRGITGAADASPEAVVTCAKKPGIAVRVIRFLLSASLNPDSASPEPGGASSASVTVCGAAGSVFRGQVQIVKVTTRNVPCQTAREFAAGFETTSGAETDFRCSENASCTWRGWRCRNDGRQARSIDHRCEKGDRVVRWQARST